jgi:hypothetical protein
MFQNAINQYYNGKDATLEILIMLLASFVLGYLLRYFLRPATNSDTKACANWNKCKDCLHCNGNVSHASTPITNSSKKDDLKIVEGIGPKVEELLNKNGVHSFSELESISYEKLSDILRQEGGKFQMLIVSAATWAKQSGMARLGDMDALKKYQDTLNAGRN